MIKCEEDGGWAVEACVEITCPEPPKIDNVLPFDKSLCEAANDDACELECAPGYEGGPMLDCGVDGSWHVHGECLPIKCPGVPPFENLGYVELSATDLAACDEVPEGTCETQCLPGYETGGRAEVDCSGHGHWEDAGACFAKVCKENERVQGNECVPCEPGTEKPAGDNAGGDDTMCEPILCETNEHVDAEHKCVACSPGSTNDGGDDASGVPTVCHVLLAGQDEHIHVHTVKECPAGTTHAAGDKATGPDTFCDPILCKANQMVSEHQCVDCPAGSTSEEGHSAAGEDTTCESILCGLNERVKDNACSACAPGTTNPAGDAADGADTTCDKTLCLVNQYVSSHECVNCEPKWTALAGADASGADTQCLEPPPEDGDLTIADFSRGVESSAVGNKPWMWKDGSYIGTNFEWKKKGLISQVQLDWEWMKNSIDPQANIEWTLMLDNEPVGDVFPMPPGGEMNMGRLITISPPVLFDAGTHMIGLHISQQVFQGGGSAQICGTTDHCGRPTTAQRFVINPHVGGGTTQKPEAPV